MLRYCSCCLSPRTIRRAKQQQEENDFKNAKITITKIDKPKKTGPPPTPEQVTEAFAKLDQVLNKMQPAVAEAKAAVHSTGNVLPTIPENAPTVVEAVTSAAQQDHTSVAVGTTGISKD